MHELVQKGIDSPQDIPSYFVNKAAGQYVRKQYQDLVHGESDLEQISTHYWTLKDDLHNLGPSLSRDAAPEANNVDIQLKPDFLFQPPKCFVIEDVTLCGPHAVGKTVYEKYIEQMLGRPSQHGSLHRKLRRTVASEWKKAGQLFSPSPGQSVETATVIHRESGSQNFYHWMIDHILKLRAVDAYQRRTGELVTLIVSEHIPTFALEAIELLGFGNNPTIVWNDCHVSVDTLVVSSWPEPTPGNIGWLRNNLDYSTSRRLSSPEWIYISRQNASRGRKIENFDQVLPILEEFDVEVVNLEEIELSTEVSLFKSADGVIAPHGAGLTGIIWTNSLSVIELFNGMVKMPFYAIAEVLEHEYHWLMGDPVRQQSGRKPRDRDFVINPNELRELLSTAYENGQ